LDEQEVDEDLQEFEKRRVEERANLLDPYEIPSKLGILETITSTSNLTVIEVVERVRSHQERFCELNYLH